LALAVSNIVVLKIGGSFLIKPGSSEPDVVELRQMASVVGELLASDAARRLVIIVGGGVSARNYIAAASALGSSAGLMDHLGILVSRLNARVFVEALREANVTDVWPEPAESLQDLRCVWSQSHAC
jgi:uridylate kinase